MARLGVATLVAALIAAFVLLAAVLPAEFGRDPLGTGKALGLLDLYEASADAASPPAAGATAPKPRVYRVDARELRLGPGQSFEFKYRLEKGAAMVYTWRTTGRLKYEFHGEPYDRTLQVVSYEKQEGDSASGALTAPFDGIHGWYWENPGESEAIITITSAGFFTSAEEFRSRFDPVKHKNRIEQITHELAAPNQR